MVIPLNLGTLVSMLIIFYRQVQPVYIYGGHEAVAHSRPYMVFLNLTHWWCDGFLVAEDFVITAAHCSKGNIEVVLGVHYVYEKDAQKIHVKKKFPHPDYNITTMENDIMLLKLEKKASVNDHVRIIDLPQTRDEKAPTNCLVSGWGLCKKGEDVGCQRLQEVNVTLVYNRKNAPGEICSEGPKSPAQGDSGGPLVCGDVAYGVVSGGVHDNNKDYAIYTNITHYLDWIHRIMKN
ncbi:hypothetical protein DPEC_G00268710 [Dallia pectoralis]|uniref:Uncharacterized protein n=1 Tax=Dallia pectoralis TaxID=75939 RepID=A0ACC2FNV9_DALPE|nr:hypothetical protein DPEC_G00268710 [Dallia pectoralis]